MVASAKQHSGAPGLAMNATGTDTVERGARPPFVVTRAGMRNLETAVDTSAAPIITPSRPGSRQSTRRPAEAGSRAGL